MQPAKKLSLEVEETTELKAIAATGAAVIVKTATQIEDVNIVLVQVNASLKELFQTMEEIDKIIRDIGDISDKADLLAINASIEAARAKAAGKGFAVVAEEVGRVASKTQLSISDIESTMKRIKLSMNEVRGKIGTCVNTSHESVIDATNAKNTFNKLVQIVDQILKNRGMT